MTNSLFDEEAFASPSPVPPVSPKDPQAKALNLSGRVITAMTSLPNQIYKHNDQWNVKHIRGNSALYSSFYYLDQQTDWETHLVGWTGELISGGAAPFGQAAAVSSNAGADAINADPLYLTDDEKSRITSKIQAANKSKNIHPVWLLRKDQQRWRQYSENVLWKIFHYIQQSVPGTRGDNDSNTIDDWWHDYVRFNEAYATKIKAIYKPGDIIWIHDYYLLLLPGILRMEFPDAYIGLYLHTPFPSSEYFRCLSRRTNLLEGMLGANRIGFQSYNFAKHFVSSCTRILGCEATHDSVNSYGRFTKVEALPTGIDANKIIEDAFKEKVDNKVKTMKQVYGDKKIIVGRDRLDTVRGVSQKLEAFERFLSMYPEWRDKVVLIQVSSPVYSNSSRTSSTSYEKEVAELVSYINGTYGSLHSNPVQHYQMRIDKDEYLALLRVADLGLITTIRDGMNTTALEFVACQHNHHSPLILSEFSGTTTVLNDAVLVNPWDSVGVAKAINDCLSMPDPKKKALEQKLYNVVNTNTVQHSTNKFLNHLIEDLGTSHDSHSTPILNRPDLLANYKHAQKRLFLFDYDGTLTPIVKDPDAAIPSARVLHLLDKLSQDPKNQIWIISGRDQQFLDKWIGSKNPRIGLSAEHGCFIKDVGSRNWVNLTESFNMAWQKDVEEIFSYYTERTPGSVIERKKVALTWHYRQADPEFGEFQAKELKQHLASTVAVNYDVEVMSGKANLEVRPRFVNKGEIVKRLTLSAHGKAQETFILSGDGSKQKQKPRPAVDFAELPDFVLCVGDDKTDEDMFEALISIEEQWGKEHNDKKNKFGHFGIFPTTVGPASKKTIAKAHLIEPKQVLETVGLLVGEVSIFETVGSLSLDDRGHIINKD